MSSPLGLMAPSTIDSDAVQGETFLPGQIFVFGGFEDLSGEKGLALDHVVVDD